MENFFNGLLEKFKIKKDRSSQDNLIEEVQRALERDKNYPKIRAKEKDVTPKVNKELKVTYVIPIKGETESGNFFHVLKDLATQNIDLHSQEAIFVVNNTEAEQNSDVYHENIGILNIIAYIAGISDTLPDLSGWQRNTVELAKRNKLQIVGIDCASTGLPKKNIPMARTIGDNLAIDRFKQTEVKGKGAIVLMDIDTRIGRNSTKGVIESLVNDDSVGMLKVQYDTIPGEGGQDIFASTNQERFTKSLRRLNNFGTPPYGQWYVIKAEELGEQEPSYANAISRDQQSSQKRTINAPDSVQFYNQDRARGKVGGQFGQDRLKEIDAGYKFQSKINHPIEILLNLYKKNKSDLLGNYILSIARDLKGVDSLKQNFDFSDKQLLETFQKQNMIEPNNYGILLFKIFSNLIHQISPEEHQDFNDSILKSIKKEKLKHELSRSFLLKSLRVIFKQGKQKISSEQIMTSMQASGTPLETFLQQNNWLVDAINSALKKNPSTSKDFITMLTEKFPDYLLPFKETAFGTSTAVCLGMTTFFEKVWNNPENYPDTASLLNTN